MTKKLSTDLAASVAENGLLTGADVLTLIGYAQIRRGSGETDMPAWLMDLAERITKVVSPNLAPRVAELREVFGAASEPAAPPAHPDSR
ncbi:TPA: hypothetical protein ACYLN4_000606 [Burkholderia lata]